MEKKSFKKTKPETKKVRFNLNTAKTDRLSLAGDVNGCVLVIPESFGMNEYIAFNQAWLPEYPL